MKQIYAALIVCAFVFSGSVYALEEQSHNSSRSNRTEGIMDSHECEKYPDRCPDYKQEREVQATGIDDCKWYPERCRDEAEESESKANYNNTRSNKSNIIISDSEIEDCKWDPPKCRDELETRMMQEKIQIKTDSTVWCWGRAGSHCSPEVREERREILKERLQIEERQYNRLQERLESRVERIFQKISEEEYDRLSERLASLIEQQQESGNTRLLAAVLVLQELLEGAGSKKGYDHYQSSSDM